MPCFTPLKAYRASGGQVVFDSKRGWSDRPFELPCGQCIGCRVARSRAWALRCVHEAQMHERNSFITLTYSPTQLPEGGSLVVKHWQDFAKRLRRELGSFRFFMCGEYGDQNLRPHYHAAIFGQDFSGDRRLVRENGRNQLYSSRVLEERWGKGFCTVGNLTYESAAYVARYVMKKVTGERARGHYGDRKPEFVCMSRRPGIGASWFDKYKSDVYPSDEVVVGGRRFRPPRFYDSRLDEAVLAELKGKRIEYAGRFRSDNTPDRLEVREQVARASLDHYSERKI